MINRIIESARSRADTEKLQDAIIDETLNPMIQQYVPGGRRKFRESDIPAVRRRQHHHEPSAVGCQCRSVAYGALYSGFLIKQILSMRLTSV